MNSLDNIISMLLSESLYTLSQERINRLLKGNYEGVSRFSVLGLVALVVDLAKELERADFDVAANLFRAFDAPGRIPLGTLLTLHHKAHDAEALASQLYDLLCERIDRDFVDPHALTETTTNVV